VLPEQEPALARPNLANQQKQEAGDKRNGEELDPIHLVRQLAGAGISKT